MPRTVPYDFQSLSVGQLYTGQWHDFRALSADPAAPPTGYGRLYSLDTPTPEDLWWERSNGDKVLLTPGSGPAPADAQFLLMTPDALLPNAFSVGFLTPTPLQDLISFTFDPLVTQGGIFITGGTTAFLNMADDSTNTVAYHGVEGGSLGDQTTAEGRVTLHSTDDNISYWRRFLASFSFNGEGNAIGRLQLNGQQGQLRIEGYNDDTAPLTRWALYSDVPFNQTTFFEMKNDGTSVQQNLTGTDGVVTYNTEILTNGVDIVLTGDPTEGRFWNLGVNGVLTFMNFQDDDSASSFQLNVNNTASMGIENDAFATQFVVNLSELGETSSIELYGDAFSGIYFTVSFGNNSEGFISLSGEPAANEFIVNLNSNGLFMILNENSGFRFKLGVGNNLEIDDLPTADPALSNRVWDNMGVLMKDAA